MSKLQELIQRLCPDGVEYKKLGEVCEVVIAPKKLNKKDYQDTGLYPIIDQGKSMIVGYTDNEEVLLPAKEYVLFGDHTRNIKYYDGAFAQGADGLKILTSKDIVLARFLYYSMQCLVIEDRGYNRHWTVVSPLLIPIPPLEVQEEIVRILDRFSDYAAELQARKEQYEYYRNLLLTFNPAGAAGEADDEQEGSVTTWGGHSYPIQWKTMGEIIKSLNTGLNPRQFFRLNTADAECFYVTIREIRNGQITINEKTDRINQKALQLCNNRSNLENFDILFSGTGTIGQVAVIKHTPKNWNIKEGVYAIKPKLSEINPFFLRYILESSKIKESIFKKVSGGTVQSIPMKDLKSILLPVPPLELQEKIVAVLDRFETLVNDLSEGLPAEIAAVKEQYEYYRNRLLTFKEKTA